MLTKQPSWLPTSGPSWAKATSQTTPTTLPHKPYRRNAAKQIPSCDILEMLAKARNSPAETLKNSFWAKVFMALIEGEFSNLADDAQKQLLMDFGIAPISSHSQGIMGLASQSINSPRNVVVQVLGSYLGIRAEYAFEAFPATRERPARWTSPTDESLLPQQLVVDEDCYVLAGIERQVDFTEYVEQAICRYQNSVGSFFYLLATRTGIEDFYGVEMPYLTIGRQSAAAYLLSRVDIDRNMNSMVILPLGLGVALQLRALAEDSRSMEKREVLVSGLIGGTAALKATELSPLVHHRVVLIPEFHRQGLLGVEEAVAQCRKAGASEVQVYPWPLLTTEPNSAMTAWAEEFQSHGIRLDEIDSSACLLRKICREALSPTEFQALLAKLRVIVDEDKASSVVARPPFAIKRLSDLGTGEGTYPTNTPSLDQIFSVGQISLLWGQSNSGKSLVALTIAFALASGGSAFSIPYSGSSRKVLLVDGELTENALRERGAQLVTSYGEAVDCNLFFISIRSSTEESCNVLSDVFPERICLAVKEQSIQVVIFDNLITLASSATRGNDDALFALIRRIEQSGAAVILVHHATKDGDSFKGSSNLASKSQNIIHIEGRDTLQVNENCSEAIKDALETDGAVVRMNWVKCKTAPKLEGTSSTFKLPLGGTWQPIDESTKPAQVAIDGEDMNQNSALGIPEGNVPERSSVAPDLSLDEKKVLDFFADGKQHNRRALEAALMCGEDKAGNLLKSLKDKGRLKAVGGGRNTAYTKV